MARRKAAAVQTEETPTTDSAPEATAERQPDVFDQAAAAAANGQFEQPNPMVQSVAEATRLPDGVLSRPEAEGHAARHRPDGPVSNVQPDPHGFASITIGSDNDDPRVRLFRHERTREGYGAGLMVIQFDEKPLGPEGEERKYLDILQDAGFRWHQGHGVWKLPIEPESRWQSVAKAQKVFAQIGNDLRKDRGLEPVTMVGM